MALSVMSAWEGFSTLGTAKTEESGSFEGQPCDTSHGHASDPEQQPRG